MGGGLFLLCAIIPPGSVEAQVGRAQEALFCAHGLASAQAVPPLVPVAFLEREGLPAGFLQRLGRAAPAGWRARPGEAQWVQGHLFVRVDTGGAWPALREALRTGGGREAEGLFPVAEGFYLGCADAPQELKESLFPSIRASSFSSGTVALVLLQAAAAGAAWWSDLHWEVAEEQPLRGRPSGRRKER